MAALLDTNVVLYLLGGRIADDPPRGGCGISVITEMELLAWPALTSSDEQRILAFIAAVTVWDLTAPIRARTVTLRRQEGLKLPDAIICATALENGLELWTNDVALKRIPGLVTKSVTLGP